jgi:hypothetical protein
MTRLKIGWVIRVHVIILITTAVGTAFPISTCRDDMVYPITFFAIWAHSVLFCISTTIMYCYRFGAHEDNYDPTRDRLDSNEGVDAMFNDDQTKSPKNNGEEALLIDAEENNVNLSPTSN